MNKYTLVNYFDVWGNAKDGWEVNNLCNETTGITITDDASEKDVLNYLKLIGFLTTSDRRQVRVDMTDGDMMEIYAVKDNYPLGSLRREF